MTITPADGRNSMIASLYLWGARVMGGILLIGVLLQFILLVSGSGAIAPSGVFALWPNLALIGLWAVPVLSITIAGCAWVIHDRRDGAGWLAVVIGVFLASLWFLK